HHVLLGIFLALVLGSGQRLLWPPVVCDLVIIPLRKHGNLSVEGEQVLVEEVVLIVGTKLDEGLSGLCLLLHCEVLPQLTVRQLDLGRYRPVGINRVAAVNEEVGIMLEHGGIGPHATARLVDTPALTAGITGPNERDIASIPGRCPEAPK